MNVPDIIKSLECCGDPTKQGCKKCPLGEASVESCYAAKLEAVKLINDQAKRIDELEERIAIMSECREEEDDSDAW